MLKLWPLEVYFVLFFFFKSNRSLCTLVCKWTYCPPEGWDSSFWTSIGLEDLLENNFSKIGELNCQTSHQAASTKQIKQLVCFSLHRQRHVSSRKSSGRRSHPGGCSGFGFGAWNRCWCLSYWRSCWRPRYASTTQTWLVFVRGFFLLLFFFTSNVDAVVYWPSSTSLHLVLNSTRAALFDWLFKDVFRSPESYYYYLFLALSTSSRTISCLVSTW